MWRTIFSAFLTGVITGVVGLGIGFFYLLSKSSSNDEEEQEATNGLGKKTVERDPNDIEIKQLEDALTRLKELKVQESDKTHDKANASYQIPIESQSAPQLEKTFLDGVKTGKDRERQMKSMSAFFAELSKAFGSTSRELQRLAGVAASNVTKSENENFSDKWWLAIGQALEHLALDNESLFDSLSNDIVGSFNSACEEHALMSKRLHTEGSNLVAGLKEISSQAEARYVDYLFPVART